MRSNLKNSVVLITSGNPEINRFGTGFIFHQEESAAYLLTCAHVVDDVGGPGHVQARTHSATVVAFGAANDIDLAVLRVEGLAGESSLPLNIFAHKGKPIVIIGYGLFDKRYLLRPLQGHLGEQVILESRGQANRILAWDLKIIGDNYLQPGYSGSPVIDEEDENVLAVVSYRQGEGKKGLAISIEALKEIWPEMPSSLFSSREIEQGHDKVRDRIASELQEISSSPAGNFSRPVYRNIEEALKALEVDNDSENQDSSSVSKSSDQHSPAYNSADIRKLLVETLRDEGITLLSYDHFPDIYRKFQSGTSERRKAKLLTDDCEQNGLLEQLLSLIEKISANR